MPRKPKPKWWVITKTAVIFVTFPIWAPVAVILMVVMLIGSAFYDLWEDLYDWCDR